ncbi:amidohydrolase family protein [Umezawaea tangerina]|uniref:Cytosine/adenosine deaminase-related metal-dependent hydrolase n=1 Tax=Umezawaea tangerina TaxID=84725 RepID=A0A2T0T1P2_9PSEU|nr:amidohydrolase family protein [Umezawaea tangerina]PRY39582.1 cytosine/adenosine deaminase-related metal-dependent hydrolase [Umezawaea tangerina]
MNLADSSVPERWSTGRTVVLGNVHVISMDSRVGDFVGDVVIEGDTIRDLGPGAGADRPDDALVVDAGGAIAIPGLVDSHVHAWEGALRGVSPDSDFMSYMALTHSTLGPLMSPEDVAVGQALTAARALDQGVTTIVDNNHNVRSREHAHAALTALRDAGVRTVFAAGVGMGQPDGHLLPLLLELRSAHDDDMTRIRLMQAFPTLDGWKFAVEHGFGAVAEFGTWLDDLDGYLTSGLLGPSFTLDHCAGLSAEQWSRVADSGAAVALAPRSDPHYGFAAAAPVLQADRVGVQVGLSSDNEFEYGSHLFEEMRQLMSAQRGAAAAATQAGEQDVPRPWGVRDALRAATVGGALAAGLPGRVGVLAPGAKADLVLLGTDRLRPITSELGAAVSYATVRDVTAVVVDGRPRKWAGELVGVDWADLVRRGEDSRDRLLARIGHSVEDLRFAGELVLGG